MPSIIDPKIKLKSQQLVLKKTQFVALSFKLSYVMVVFLIMFQWNEILNKSNYKMKINR